MALLLITSTLESIKKRKATAINEIQYKAEATATEVATV